MTTHAESINCPQCGNSLPLKFQHTKLTVCSHCDSTLFLNDDTAKFAGKQSTLSNAPSMMQMHKHFQYKTESFMPIGMIRYAHKIGYWEEWWVMTNSGEGFWVSIDEGDFAIEKPITLDEPAPELSDITLGDSFTFFKKKWQVTEIDTGICEGFTGELPELIKQGEKVPFVHLSGRSGELMTLEYIYNTVRAFKGQWVDPFEIKALS